MTADRIARFVSVLLRELVDNEGHHYDAVYAALAESGIQPLPSIQCETLHFDARVERSNRLADELVERIVADRGIHAAMGALATTVLDHYTIPAPEEHMTNSELHEFIACCRPVEHDGHIPEERYAAHHAHLGMCAPCDRRLQDAIDRNRSG